MIIEQVFWREQQIIAKSHARRMGLTCFYIADLGRQDHANLLKKN